MNKWLDINLNNNFLSNVNDPSPVVKLGDLGMCMSSSVSYPSPILIWIVINEGYNKQRVQSLPCRAPEVWQGISCFHASDVWSGGVTVSYIPTLLRFRLIEKLANWLYGGPIFGARDKIIDNHTEAWCIAKLQHLVGPLGLCIHCPLYEDEFELAKQLMSMEIDPVGKLIKLSTLRQELQSLSGPSVSPKLLDFINYLLIVDMTKRPTARDALQHLYLQSD